jgi:hypothetical protein
MEDGNRQRKSSRVWRTAAIVFGVSAVAAVLLLLNRHLPRPANRVSLNPDRIVAYYFHRTTRYPTCERIESYAREAIESAFTQQLTDGRLQWQSVDYEAPDNERYATDYKLTASCMVLVRMRENQPVEWRSVPEVWNHVGDKSSLINVVQRNVREFLDYIEAPGACCM